MLKLDFGHEATTALETRIKAAEAKILEHESRITLLISLLTRENTKGETVLSKPGKEVARTWNAGQPMK